MQAGRLRVLRVSECRYAPRRVPQHRGDGVHRSGAVAGVAAALAGLQAERQRRRPLPARPRHARLHHAAPHSAAATRESSRRSNAQIRF